MTGSYKDEQIAKLKEHADDLRAEAEYLKTDVGVEVDTLVQTYRDQHDKVTYSDALNSVLNDPSNSEVARRYRGSFPNAERKDARLNKS